MMAVLTNPQAPPAPAPSRPAPPVSEPARVQPVPSRPVVQPQPQSQPLPAQATPPVRPAPAPAIERDPLLETQDPSPPTPERTRPPEPADAPPVTEPDAPEPDLAARVGDLPGQQLEPGACGMFLFRRQPRSRLVFFNHGIEGRARMVLDGKEVDLERTSASGPAFVGLYARQTFAHEGYTIEVNAQIEQSTRILDGAEVRQGRIRLEDASGWSFVIPVAGLIACQTVKGANGAPG